MSSIWEGHWWDSGRKVSMGPKSVGHNAQVSSDWTRSDLNYRN